MQSGSGGSSLATERVIEVKGRGPGATTDAFVRAAGELGLTVVATGPNRFRLARSYRPGWAIALAIVTSLCVGVGLLFLLVKRTESADVVVVEDRSGVRLRLVGDLAPAVLDRIEAALSAGQAGRPADAASAAAPQWNAPDVSPSPTSYTPPTTAGSSWSAPQPAIAPSSPTTAPAPVRIEQPTTRLVFTLSDGRRVSIAAGGVIGRNPRPDLAPPGSSLVPIDDPSLSKSHLTFGPADGGVWVVDLHSTNGTSIQLGAAATRCEPGQRVTAPIGAVVVAGDVRMAVTVE